jgi:hypothetical protein
MLQSIKQVVKNVEENYGSKPVCIGPLIKQFFTKDQLHQLELKYDVNKKITYRGTYF